MISMKLFMMKFQLVCSGGDRMFVTAQILSKECNVSTKTILAKANQMEHEGIKVKSRIGRPTQINRELFMKWAFPGWREDNES